MFIQKYVVLFISILSFLLVSCSDSPTSIGQGNLNPDFIGVNQIDSNTDSIPQTSAYFKRTLPLGASEKLLVGKSNNAESSVLMNFFIFLNDTLRTDVREDRISIISSTVDLVKVYSYGDSLSTLDFTVHKVNNRWSSNTFTADSLSLLDYDQADMSSDKVQTDTSASFKIDNAIVLEWMKDSEDSTRHDDFGMYIKPVASAQKVVGFQALSSIADAATIPNLTIIYEKPGSYIDTLVFIPEADISVIAGTLPVVSGGNIAIQSGVVVNSRIGFDLTGIPKNAVINFAELTLTIDTLETITGSSFTNRLNAFALLDSAVIDTLSRHVSNPTVLARLEKENKFSGNITSIIQAIHSRNNFGILITTGEEVEGLELFAIKGSNAADVSSRPLLKIIYTNNK